jgi:hypothetical protein
LHIPWLWMQPTSTLCIWCFNSLYTWCTNIFLVWKKRLLEGYWGRYLPKSLRAMLFNHRHWSIQCWVYTGSNAL